MRTHIIAELAWGHDGKLSQAIELLKEAKTAGADSFSIHITDLPSYMVPYYGSGEGKVSAGRENLEVYKYLENINLLQEDWLEFAKQAKKIKMPLCIMPNDEISLDFAEKKLKPEFYVISAACFVEDGFLMKVAKTKRKTLFRIGGAHLGEIERAITIFREEGNNNIILLHGFQNYPTKLEETDISVIELLKGLFNVEVGLADHIDGGQDIAKIMPILAIPYGATYIEKHITLNRNLKSEDFESALDPNDFADFVRYIRAAEIAIGTKGFKDLSDATKKYRSISRKRIVARRNICKGSKLVLEDLAFKRCDIGLTPDYVSTVIGRSINQDLVENDAIVFDKLV